MRATAFLVYATVVTLMPALVMAYHHGGLASWAFITGDAYLYLGIARNSPADFYSFDGSRPTNGFHPFWQYYAWLITDLFRDNPQAIRNIVSWSAIILTWIGSVLGGLAARKMSGSWILACLVTPGAYFLLIGQAVDNVSVWSFFTAMEAGLTFALAGGILLIAAHAERWQDRPVYWLGLGITIAALVFARLDEVFVALSISAALLLWPGRGIRIGLRDGLLVSVPVAAVIAAYFAYNLAQLGILMPISGEAKGEGALVPNAWLTLLTLFSPLVELREALTQYVADRNALSGAAFRVLELCIPAGVALLVLVSLFRLFPQKAWAPILAGACGGVIIKAAYNFVFVGYWHQAPWYFGFAAMVVSVGLAAVLGPALLRLRTQMPSAAVGIGVFLVAFGLFHASYRSLPASYGAKTLTGGSEAFERMRFWDDRAALEADLRRKVPDIRLLEFGDGMLGYTFNFPVRHGFVFAGDLASLEALRQSRLLRDSHADGFQVLAAYEYIRLLPEASEWTSDVIRAYLEASYLDDWIKAELGFFDFSVIHLDAPTGIAFIEFTLREGA